MDGGGGGGGVFFKQGLYMQNRLQKKRGVDARKRDVNAEWTIREMGILQRIDCSL